MPRKLTGWNKADLHFFLESHGFEIVKKLSGSHNNWMNKEKGIPVQVHELHGRDAYRPQSLKSIIENMGLTHHYAHKWEQMSKTQQKKFAKQIKQTK